MKPDLRRITEIAWVGDPDEIQQAWTEHDAEIRRATVERIRYAVTHRGLYLSPSVNTDLMRILDAEAER